MRTLIIALVIIRLVIVTDFCGRCYAPRLVTFLASRSEPFVTHVTDLRDEGDGIACRTRFLQRTMHARFLWLSQSEDYRHEVFHWLLMHGYLPLNLFII